MEHEKMIDLYNKIVESTHKKKIAWKPLGDKDEVFSASIEDHRINVMKLSTGTILFWLTNPKGKNIGEYRISSVNQQFNQATKFYEEIWRISFNVDESIDRIIKGIDNLNQLK